MRFPFLRKNKKPAAPVSRNQTQHIFCAKIAADLCDKPEIAKFATMFFNEQCVDLDKRGAYVHGFQFGLTEGLYLILSGQVEIKQVVRDMEPEND